MTNKDQIRSELISFLEDAFNMTPESYSFGQLDSLSVIRLIVSLEEKFGLTIELPDLQESNVGDFNRLMSFIERKTLLARA